MNCKHNKMIKHSVLLILLATCYANSNMTSFCSQKEILSSYLDVAVDMITKTKNSFPTWENYVVNRTLQVVDCADIFRMGHKESGVYKVWPMNRVIVDKSLDVYCDMETNGGGWTVIQRRGDYKRPNDYFYKDWKSYKEGFGDIERDFWLGNDNIFALTNQKLYSVRFDLQDAENSKRYAHYDKLWINDEYNKYTLHISDFSGDAGDSMIYHNNQKFSTKDQENDSSKTRNCAQTFKEAWWYNDCHHSNLNGLYLKGKHENAGDEVDWKFWKGDKESLLTTEIKIRPENFRQPSASFTMTPMK